MRALLTGLLVVAALGLSVLDMGGRDTKAPANAVWKLDTLDNLELVHAKADAVSYQGRKAVRLLLLPGSVDANARVLAVLSGTDFKDGTIEVNVAGKPAEGAPESARGFIGLAFRVQPHAEKFECFYIRPTNGRADDQLRRNHSTQYISFPEYPWERLRKENPGVYESYADLEAAAWTKLKIVVAGTKAQLYVNGATQPTLIVNDLKLGESRGQIALWSELWTEGYFSELKIEAK
jgi:hypothetical protein